MKTERRQQDAAISPPAPERRLPSAALIFGAAFLVRLAHIWQIRSSPFFSVLMGDARGYDEWARRLAAGDWIGSDVFYQAPLYPYFLGLVYAVAGRDLLAVRIVQAVLGSTACVLVGLAAWRLFSKRVGLTAGLGLAIYAPAIFFDGLIQKSVLDVFFISLSLWLLSGLATDTPLATNTPSAGRPFQARQPGRVALRALILGLAMGALSLTRENALVLVAVVFAWIVVVLKPETAAARLKPDTTARGGRKARLTASTGGSGASRTRLAGAFALGLAIVLVPVAIRNYAVGGGFYLTTSQFGPNFFIGNNPRADGTYMSLRYGRGSQEYERQDATDLAERATGRQLTPSEVSSYWTERALGFITSQPGAWLGLLGRKFVLLWNADEMLDTESQETYAEWSAPLRVFGWFTHFGVLVPLAVLGAWSTWPDRRRLMVFYALTLAYAASVVMFYVFARYRFPLVPMLFLFAAPGLCAVADGVWPKRRESPAAMPSRGQADPRRQAGIPAGVIAMIALAAVLANWPMLSPALMQAITENNLAAALHEDGRVDEAIVHYERAIARQPDYAPAHSNFGAALRAKGRLDEAIGAYEKALALQPDSPDTHFNLANALLDKNRPQEAAEHFRLAGRAAPATGNVHNNLGIALAAEGKLQEAAAAFRQALAIEPDSARAHRNLGDVLVSLGQVDEGVGHFRRAIELDPSSATFHYDLAVVLLDAGRHGDAISEFNAALKIDPSFAPAHNNLGVALGSQGRLDEAIDHFRQALKIQPDYADAQRNLQMALRAR